MEALFQTALSDFKVEALFTPKQDVLAERYSLYVKPNFDTACWTWTPPHRIFLGDQVLHRLKPGADDEQKLAYLKSYLWHEYAHACFTERDMAHTDAQLKRIRAPFQVYNRFEDIRIEHHARARWENFRFDWALHESLAPVTGSTARDADSILFLLTQLEGDASAARSLVTDQDLFTEVLAFYREACACRTSMALIPVIARWLHRFPQAQSPQGQSGGGVQDMSLSAQLSLVPGLLEQFMQDVQGNNESKPPGGDDAREHLTDYDPRSDASRDGQQGAVLGQQPSIVNEADVAQVTEALAALYSKRPVKVSTVTPTKRVSIRHHVLGRGPYRRTELQGKAHKKVAVVIDCSGSMQGFHIASARVLAQALSNLAQAGAVEGYIVLSKVSCDGPVWERFRLPMSDGAIARITADGLGEGLAPALYANKALASQMDLLLVYTDADITDAPLDKHWLHSLGVFTVGVYVGRAPEALGKLKRYFDRALVRDTVHDLVRDLLLTL